MNAKPNRVWIELDPTSSTEVGNARAALLSTMLRRLGSAYKEPVFFMPGDKMRYCFQIDGSGAFMEASDHGFWFSLDHFGREIEEEADAPEQTAT